MQSYPPFCNHCKGNFKMGVSLYCMSKKLGGGGISVYWIVLQNILCPQTQINIEHSLT